MHLHGVVVPHPLEETQDAPTVAGLQGHSLSEKRIQVAMDMIPVTLTLTLTTVAHDGRCMVVRRQDRGCHLHVRLVEGEGDGCDHVRAVSACIVFAPPSRSCEESDVEIDLDVHYHNGHAYNQEKI